MNEGLQMICQSIPMFLSLDATEKELGLLHEDVGLGR